MTRVRMLVDHKVEGLNYKCNQVVDFPASLAAELVGGNFVDASPGAVEYGLAELGQEPLVHVSAALAAASQELAALHEVHETLQAAYQKEDDAARRAEIGKQSDAVWAQICEKTAQVEALRPQPALDAPAAPAPMAAEDAPVVRKEVAKKTRKGFFRN